MKVLLVDQIAKINYKYTFPLANGLVKAGADVTLAIDRKSEKENCLCDRIQLFNTGEKNVSKVRKLLNYIASYRTMEKILKKEHYDIFHTEWYTFSPIDYYFIHKFVRKYGVRYVSTVHDILPFNQKFYDMAFHKKLYALADAVILQAPGNVQRFSELFPELKNKIHMIPHGHMLDYVESSDKAEGQKKLGIPKDKLVLLFFGQIKKVKGVDLLLQALVILKSKYPELFVVIAGSVWKADFTECQSIIDNNDLTKYLKTDIRYIPNSEVKDFYSSADVCVLPYTDVYQSGVIQLAYGYKKAVICSDLSAFTQFVHEGETGFVFSNGNVESLAHAIERAIDNRKRLQKIGTAGYELVKKNLNWDDLTRKIVDECY